MSEQDKSCELSKRIIAGMEFERCGTSAWCPTSLDAATYPRDYHCDLLSFDDNRLISAPVKTPVRILDVGTGPGILAGELAKRFPDADVIGLDVFSNPPAEFPETCEYQSGNIEEPWEFETGYFCLIVMRNVGVYIRHHKWCSIYSEILRCLRPGGHFEHSEIDILSDKPMVERCLHYELSRTDFPSLPAWERYEIVSDFVALLGGRHSNIAHNMHNRFTEAGFVNIISRDVKLSACHLDGDLENRIAALHSILAEPQFGEVASERYMQLIPTRAELFWDSNARQKNNFARRIIVYGQKRSCHEHRDDIVMRSSFGSQGS